LFRRRSFKQINLPLNVPHKQELLDPWRMLVSPIWCGHEACPPLVATAGAAEGGLRAGARQPPPPAGQHPPGRDPPPGWGPVGITVDDDSLPHILTFTRMPAGA